VSADMPPAWSCPRCQGPMFTIRVLIVRNGSN
jgi:hypothetical protein